MSQNQENRRNEPENENQLVRGETGEDEEHSQAQPTEFDSRRSALERREANFSQNGKKVDSGQFEGVLEDSEDSGNHTAILETSPSGFLSKIGFSWCSRIVKCFKICKDYPASLEDLVDQIEAQAPKIDLPLTKRELGGCLNLVKNPKISIFGFVLKNHFLEIIELFLVATMLALSHLTSFLVITFSLSLFYGLDDQTKFSPSWAYLAIFTASRLLNSLLQAHYTYRCSAIGLKFEKKVKKVGFQLLLKSSIFRAPKHPKIDLEGSWYLLATENVSYLSQIFQKTFKTMQNLIQILLTFLTILTLFGPSLAIWSTTLPILYTKASIVANQAPQNTQKLHSALQAQKGSRMAFFRNLVSNADYIKLSSLENFYCIRMYEKRKIEILALRKIAKRKVFGAVLSSLGMPWGLLVPVLMFFGLFGGLGGGGIWVGFEEFGVVFGVVLWMLWDPVHELGCFGAGFMVEAGIRLKFLQKFFGVLSTIEVQKTAKNTANEDNKAQWRAPESLNSRKNPEIAIMVKNKTFGWGPNPAFPNPQKSTQKGLKGATDTPKTQTNPETATWGSFKREELLTTTKTVQGDQYTAMHNEDAFTEYSDGQHPPDYENVAQNAENRQNGQNHENGENKQDPLIETATSYESTLIDYEEPSKAPEDDPNSSENAKFSLKNITLEIKKSAKIAVLGKSKSGKSSLLYALNSEMAELGDSGALEVTGTVSFMSQFRWVFEGNLRDNIVFGLPFDEARLQEALLASQLDKDLGNFSDGLDTWIPASGALCTVTLAQRARIILARCFYRRPEIMILDNPSSSLNTPLLEAVMTQFTDKASRWSQCTLIFATNDLDMLEFADEVIFLQNGKIKFQGPISNFRSLRYYSDLESHLSESKAGMDSLQRSEITQKNENEEEAAPDVQGSPRAQQSPENSRRKRSVVPEELQPFYSVYSEEPTINLQMTSIDENQTQRDRMGAIRPLPTQQSPSHAQNQPRSRNSRIPEFRLKMRKKRFLKPFMNKERTRPGRVGFSALAFTLTHLGGPISIIPLVTAIWIFIVIQAKLISSTTLGMLENAPKSPINALEVENAQKVVFRILTLLALSSACRVVLGLMVRQMCLDASRSIHSNFIFRLFHSKIGEFLYKTNIGILVNLMSKDLQNVDTGLAEALINTINSLVMASAFAWLCYQSFPESGGLLLLVLLIGGFWLREKSVRVKRELKRRQMVLQSKILSMSKNAIFGSPVIRVHNLGPLYASRWSSLLNKSLLLSRMSSGVDSWLQIRYSILGIIATLIPTYPLIMYIYEYTTNPTTPQNASEIAKKLEKFIIRLTFFMLFFSRFQDHISLLLTHVTSLELSLTSAERIYSYIYEMDPETGYLKLDKEIKIFSDPHQNSVTCRRIVRSRRKRRVFRSGRVEFLNLWACYPSRVTPVLSDLKMVINSGERVGVIGRTASGKSTFTRLLWRALEPIKGQILVDGKCIESYDLKVYRDQITIIAERSHIIAGTLLENITEREVQEDQKDEILEDLIFLGFSAKKLKNRGLLYTLEADGVRLSEGERMIVSLVRAIHHKSRITVIDEASVSVNGETKRRFEQVCRLRFEDCTIIYITHKVVSLLSCDRIVVLEGGRIAEQGCTSDIVREPESVFKGLYQA